MKGFAARLSTRLKRTHFGRRGAALAIDMTIVFLISLPIMVLITWLLSVISPSRSENPFRQVRAALSEHRPIMIRLEMFTEAGRHEAEPGQVVIGEGKGWIEEIFAFYAYYILFFRFGGRTPGKRLLRLRVVKVDGSRLGWWSAFERAHGYIFSTSVAFLGFLQVLWDPHGATIHDRIAETTVVALPKRAKEIPEKA
jgi:uncharacterized RDD family membrane protein YckC